MELAAGLPVRRLGAHSFVPIFAQLGPSNGIGSDWEIIGAGAWGGGDITFSCEGCVAVAGDMPVWDVGARTMRLWKGVCDEGNILVFALGPLGVGLLQAEAPANYKSGYETI